MNLNQDDVLGGKTDDLSPNEFADDEMESSTPKKKASKLIPILGIVGCVIIVAFFVWKIFIAPYMARSGNDANSNGLQPVPVNSQAAVTPPTIPSATQAPPMPAQVQASAPAPANQAIQQQGNPPAQVPVTPTTMQRSSASDMPQQQTPAVNTQPQPSTAQAVVAPQAGDDVARLTSRVNAMEKSIAEIRATLEKMTGSHPASRRPAMSASKKTARKSSSEKKVPSSSIKPTADSTAQPESRSDLHLKAVLEGRAWFQDKAGASITVAPGDSVPGIGTVKAINADEGVVTFTNGLQVK